MAVMRVEKNSDYTVVDNFYLRDKRLSLKTKGLFTIMLSLPDDWDFSINGLAAFLKDGRDSIAKALSELESFGYLKRRRATDPKGHFAGYEYDIFEQPQDNTPYSEKPCTENPNTEKPYTGTPCTENPTQQSTKKQSTKKTKLSSKSDDDTDGQLSLTEENHSETVDKPEKENTVTKSIQEAAEHIYSAYPRKEGKAKGFEQVGQWLKGRQISGIGRVKFNHEELYCAVRDYAMDCEENARETKFIQLFGTFMNKTVLDYVEKSAEGYKKYMQCKYGEEWRNVKFEYG